MTSRATLRREATLMVARRARETPEQTEARREYQRGYQRRKYRALRAAGLCVSCRAPTPTTYCDACRPRVPR
jgi:hypothetical protein